MDIDKKKMLINQLKPLFYQSELTKDEKDRIRILGEMDNILREAGFLPSFNKKTGSLHFNDGTGYWEIMNELRIIARSDPDHQLKILQSLGNQ